MKKILPILFVLFLSHLSTAQYNEVINFGISGEGSQVKNSIIDSLGNLIVCSRIGEDLHVASFSPNHTLNWSNIIHNSSNSVNGDIHASPDGSYFVRTKKEVMKLDSIGGLIWGKELENPVNGMYVGCALPNGGFAVMGLMTSDYLSTLIVFDANGNIEWSKKIESSTTFSVARKILITPQGNILTFCDVAGISSALLTVWDLNGNVLSEKQYKLDATGYQSSYSPSAKFTSNGHLYITGYIGGQVTQPGTRDMVVYHFDENLEFVNGKQYSYTFDEEGRDIVEDEDGNLIAIGLTKPQLNCTGLLKVMKLTPNLDTIFTRHYGNIANGYMFTAVDRMDTIIYATGAGSFYSHFASGDGYVIKTDKEFNLSCGQYPYYTDVNDIDMIETNHAITYSITDRTFIPYSYEMPSSIESYVSCFGAGPTIGLPEQGKDDFLIYPNPFSQQISVSSDQKVEKVEIYSIGGQLVRQEIVNGTSVDVDCSELESGVYFVRLTTENAIFDKKLIKR